MIEMISEKPGQFITNMVAFGIVNLIPQILVLQKKVVFFGVGLCLNAVCTFILTLCIG